jgi:Trypsin-co-occurring domain 1
MNQEDRTEWQPITLPGPEGRRIYIEALSRGGREEVGLLESIPFEQVAELVSSIASGIGEQLKKVKPQKATLELGIEFGLENGKLVGLIARGCGKANLKISLAWEHASGAEL